MLIKSQNPLVPDLTTLTLDSTDLNQADFFCRTLNYPFDPIKWTQLYEINKEKTPEVYTSLYQGKIPNNIDNWTEATEEWQTILQHQTLIEAIEPIKKGFIKRCAMKWGHGYTFEQYMQLENLFSNTLANTGISAPTQIDSIKKLCKISCKLDEAIDAGDVAIIKDLTSVYGTLVKSTDIENVIEADDGTIRTVNDLVAYLEEINYQFKFYDGGVRDEIDKTINDMKEYLRVLVTENTGLGTTLENITANYMRSIEAAASEAAAEDYTLEQIVENAYEGKNAADEELALQDVGDDDDGEW